MKGSFTLGKEERLKSRKQIEEVFANGKKISIGELKVFYIVAGKRGITEKPDTATNTKDLSRQQKALEEAGPTVSHQEQTIFSKAVLQLGVGAGTKNFKRAVDRNRIKRLLRECWRLNNGELKKLTFTLNKSLFVFIIYTGKELPNYQDVESAINNLMKRLINAVQNK